MNSLKLLFFSALLLISAGCSLSSDKPSRPEGVNHFMLCWMMEPNNLQDMQKIQSAVEAFKAIPGITSVRMGRIIPSNNQFADNTFDLGIYMTFPNETNMEAYLANPNYIRQIRSVFISLTLKLVTYDFK